MSNFDFVPFTIESADELDAIRLDAMRCVVCVMCRAAATGAVMESGAVWAAVDERGRHEATLKDGSSSFVPCRATAELGARGLIVNGRPIGA